VEDRVRRFGEIPAGIHQGAVEVKDDETEAGLQRLE
jgi:hypothetical protein